VLETPIDETVLNGLTKLSQNGSEFAFKIVKLYLRTMPSMLKQLEAAALADDMEWLRIANHDLNSASTAVGAVRLAARCNELDRMLRTGRAVDAQHRARIVAEECSRAEADLQSWYRSQQRG
jgi:HPt (histidine-containing phosphotransfer) domain-containing protein